MIVKGLLAHRAERASNLTFSKCLHLVDLNNPRILMTHDKMAVTATDAGIKSPEFPNWYNSRFRGLFILKNT